MKILFIFLCSGRKSTCLVFVVLYIYSCATKHFNSFAILMTGRITGGIATSILFSCFESWMISEHSKRSFPESSLNQMFYIQVLGNGLVAIASGVLASTVTDYFKTMTAPFDAAIVFLIIGGILIFFTWNENYGNAQVDWRSNFTNGIASLKNGTVAPIVTL